MTNRYRPHVLVVPEDDANRQIANGFLLDESISAGNIQVLEEVGGWREVLARFEADHIRGLDKYPSRFVVLLVDFDGHEERLSAAKAVVPDRLGDRVFVLGAWTDPEDLRRAGLGTYETIGKLIAADCRADKDSIGRHTLLRHNISEIQRLRHTVRPILFGPA